jgi:uncharacterized protein YukE
MSDIKMHTEEAKARSGELEQIVIGLRDDKYRVTSALTALRENWQSLACNEFHALMRDWIDRLGGKISDLQGLKISLDQCIAAHEQVDEKLG